MKNYPGDISMLQPAKNPDAIQPKVAILLCTYHGQDYLEEQLDSLAIQTHTNWKIWASDDGSQDNTQAILAKYQNKWSETRLSWSLGPARGFAVNFLSLTCKPNIEADYYAYSDQDDIWEPFKLERAVKWLSTIPSNVPALYCSRTCLVDVKNNEIGMSPLFSRAPSFANALMQNIGGGNTMVFNKSARELLREAGDDQPISAHDWWTYIVVTGCGGEVFYDPNPTLRYRQHNNNLVGMNSSWRARFKRLQALWQGCFRSWSDGHISALKTLQHRLTPDNLKILEDFTQARKMRLPHRLLQFKRCGIYRQTLLGNIGLAIAAIFKKI